MDTYSTQSLYEASYLMANGFLIISRKTDGQKTHILFEDTPKLKQAVMAFYNGDGMVNAKSFVNNYRSLKDMVFQRPGRGYGI